MSNRTQLILDKLKTKACLKQNVYATTLATFEQLKGIAIIIATDLAKEMAEIDDKVVIEYIDKGKFEFHIKFSGDTLVFQMHSNIVALPQADPLLKNPYFEDEENKFFGTIRVYNFLSDSIKYNRLTDQGILLARMLVNKEKHYNIEASLFFKNLKPNIEKNIIDETNLRFFIENAIISAIDNDLIAPPYQKIQVVSWQQQLANNQGKAGSKLGFQMNFD